MIAKYCNPLGRLGRASEVGKGGGRAETGETSSNRSNTTTFGSVLASIAGRLGDGIWFVKLLACDCTLSRRLLGDDDAVAYSGSSKKLSGVTTTPKVPGRCVSAFRCLSSSVERTRKAGSPSCCLRIRSLLGLGLASAVQQSACFRIPLLFGKNNAGGKLTIPDSISSRFNIGVLGLSTTGCITELRKVSEKCSARHVVSTERIAKFHFE